jgi:CRP/FNR family transcriptional regulator
MNTVMRFDGTIIHGRSGPASSCHTCAMRAHGICGTVLPKHARRLVRARQMIHRPSDHIEGMQLICSGWAYSYTVLPDSRRQILSFLLPGDLVSARALLTDRVTRSVHTLTDVEYCMYDRDELMESLRTEPKVFRQFAEMLAAELEEADQLVTDMGRRSAEQRIARLILSLMSRLAARKQVHDNAFEFPLRQQHIADATGVTSVHVSRIVSQMRDSGLIDIRARKLKVLRPTELQQMSNSLV